MHIARYVPQLSQEQKYGFEKKTVGGSINIDGLEKYGLSKKNHAELISA